MTMTRIRTQVVEMATAELDEKVEVLSIHPKTCTTKQLYGQFVNDDSSKWVDGLITRYLRYLLLTSRHLYKKVCVRVRSE